MNFKRNFVLGDSWIYYKLYISDLYVDDILSNNVLKLVNKLYSKKIISKFFFVRYNDPDFHLRIRFELFSLDSISELIYMVKKEFYPLLVSGAISDIQLATYKREIERYKPIPIGLVESFFSINSITIIHLIKKTTIQDAFRWIFILKWIDNIFSLFNLSIYDRHNMVLQLRNSFCTEFNIDKKFFKSVNLKYKENRDYIQSFMSFDDRDKYNIFYSILEEDICLLRKFFFDKININNVLLNSNVFSNIFGLLHMCINRSFVRNNRFHEVVLYDLLRRYYEYKIHIL